MRMRVNSFRLESPKIVKPSKILVMSDIHNNQEIFDDLLEIVGEQKPDYICLAGDTLDEADCDIAGLVDWLKKLAKKATVIIGLGNHELCWCDRPFRRPVPGENQDFYSAIGKIKNCVLLKDEFSTYQPDDNLAFSALNMPISWYSDRRENKAEFKKAVKRAGREAASGGAANKLDKGRFNVLLSHSPNGWLFRGKLLARDEFRLMNRLDLILSGHNHGGLVPGILRPVLRHYGFVGPSAKVVQPHAFGFWTDGKTSLILSDGVTKFAESSGFAAMGRLLNRVYIPDIESITLVPGEQYKLVKDRKPLKIFR